MSISLKCGRLIALIDEEQPIFLNTGEKCCKKCSQSCLLKKCCKKCLRLEQTRTSISVQGQISQTPNPNTREIIYVAGPSGSGKSTYIANYAKNYKLMFPKNDIFLFSRKNEDDVLDEIGLNRIIIDESLIEYPIVTEDLSNSLVIFDDIDTISDPKIKQAVYKIKDDICEIGRSMNIYCAVVSHLINGNDRKTTRVILNELHTFTFFPSSGSAYQIKYALKNYFGLDNKQIDKLLKIPSRWITLSKIYPQYCMYEHGVFMLSNI